METVLWQIFMIPTSALFTALGVFAWRRKKPMWFWSGSTVDSSEISDVPAYNRANGIMWISYSAVFWASVILGFFQVEAAGIVVAAGSLGGIPVLVFAYNKIYDKYRIK